MRTKVTERGQREGYSVFLVPFLVNYFPAGIADLRTIENHIAANVCEQTFTNLKFFNRKGLQGFAKGAKRRFLCFLFSFCG